mmetsp:Transcript_21046/g.39117  ORF Transcript_21046/g.39117 Transcript_21046/m.39117 type:complete len:217 (-) Transcript_21046:733-1383(-)
MVTWCVSISYQELVVVVPDLVQSAEKGSGARSLEDRVDGVDNTVQGENVGSLQERQDLSLSLELVGECLQFPLVDDLGRVECLVGDNVRFENTDEQLGQPHITGDFFKRSSGGCVEGIPSRISWREHSVHSVMCLGEHRSQAGCGQCFEKLRVGHICDGLQGQTRWDENSVDCVDNTTLRFDIVHDDVRCPLIDAGSVPREGKARPRKERALLAAQ